MKFLIGVLLIVPFCILQIEALRDKFELKNCGGPNDVIQFKNLSISPIPIRLPGELRITANVTVREDLPAKTTIRVKLYRQTHIIFPIDVKIPCISNAGSCDYDACSLLSLTQNKICKFFPQGRECKCPFRAGSYGATNHVIHIPSVSGIISWLAKGDYKAYVVVEGNGRQLACFDAFLSLA